MSGDQDPGRLLGHRFTSVAAVAVHAAGPGAEGFEVAVERQIVPVVGHARGADREIVRVIIVPVIANEEPAHEYADIRHVLSTATADEARPENSRADLRLLTIADAFELTDEANMWESLPRVGRLLDAA
jgi:hypothetical protein